MGPHEGVRTPRNDSVEQVGARYEPLLIYYPFQGLCKEERDVA